MHRESSFFFLFSISLCSSERARRHKSFYSLVLREKEKERENKANKKCLSAFFRLTMLAEKTSGSLMEEGREGPRRGAAPLLTKLLSSRWSVVLWGSGTTGLRRRRESAAAKSAIKLFSRHKLG